MILVLTHLDEMEGIDKPVCVVDFPDNYDQGRILNTFKPNMLKAGKYKIFKCEPMWEYKTDNVITASFVHSKGEKIPQ